MATGTPEEVAKKQEEHYRAVFERRVEIANLSFTIIVSLRYAMHHVILAKWNLISKFRNNRYILWQKHIVTMSNGGFNHV